MLAVICKTLLCTPCFKTAFFSDDDVSDEFFEVTLSDVRKMFADLKHET